MPSEFSTKYKNWKVGNRIDSTRTFYDQEFIFWRMGRSWRLVHCGWFRSWQFWWAVRELDAGRIYFAMRVHGEVK